MNEISQISQAPRVQNLFLELQQNLTFNEVKWNEIEETCRDIVKVLQTRNLDKVCVPLDVVIHTFIEIWGKCTQDGMNEKQKEQALAFSLDAFSLFVQGRNSIFSQNHKRITILF